MFERANIDRRLLFWRSRARWASMPTVTDWLAAGTTGECTRPESAGPELAAAAELAAPGTELEIDIYGEMCRAVVQEDQPLWDPQNERLRA